MGIGNQINDFLVLLLSLLFAVIVIVVMAQLAPELINALAVALEDPQAASFALGNMLARFVPVGYWASTLVVSFLPAVIVAVRMARESRGA